MLNKIFNTIIWIAVGFFACLFMLKSCDKKTNAPVILSPKQIVKKQQKDSKEYTQMHDAALADLKKLLKQNSILKKELLQERKSRRMAEKELNIAINKLPDSLQTQVQQAADEYAVFANESDAACDSISSNYQKQLQQKDIQLSAKDSLFAVQKKALDIALSQQQSLQKINRKTKAGKIFWKITTAVAVGFLIKQSIK